MSILKVAQAAGVSKSTVSLVINNSPSVAPATALRVRQAMARLGYQPSPRDQRRGPKPAIAEQDRRLALTLLTIGIPPAVQRAPLYSDVLHGIAAAAREGGHRLNLVTAPDPASIDPHELLRNGGDGILLFGRGETPALRNALRHSACVALMGVDAPRTWCDWVGFDDASVGILAAEHLLAQGHRHCAYIGPPGWRRGAVFAETVRAAGADVEMLEAPNLVCVKDDLHAVDSTVLSALAQFLLSRDPRPTAVFVWADMVTASLHPHLITLGVQPGRDIALVTCNNEWPLLAGLTPRPAVIDVQGIKIGRRAVQQLIWRTQNRGESRVAVLLDPVLVP